MPIKLPSNGTVLFQGDSITDAGRSYENDEMRGAGYAMLASAWLSAEYPEKNLRFVTRGISGNRVKDLKSRWQKDCLDLKPKAVSIMIGINDVWRRYDSNDPTSVESFEADYRHILTQTQDTLNPQIILMEPFLLHVTKDQLKWREDLTPKIGVAKRLSREFKTILVPLDKIFAEAAQRKEPIFWSQDGVHPTLAGHALIAQSWLKAVKAI
jgi:acyl-CoA thioesterase-1